MAELIRASVAGSPGAAPADATLSALQEIPTPAPVSWLPQTWGWAVLAALLLTVLALLAWRVYRRRQASRYRREALAELARIEAMLADEHSRAGALAALPALVKRVVLAFAPRAQVASLSAQAWLAYLDGTWRAGSFTSGPGRLLPELAYGSQPPAAAEVTALVALLRDWIGQHHARL
ncbi:DUF4381 domain-containing protein [Cupriavidus sp. 2TAF22]|uniref:DUF4381 domain-containing protein n=1 Tax=unclassified Cupriavidus TaxID=2640874 RepID=UPI003F8E2F9B